MARRQVIVAETSSGESPTERIYAVLRSGDPKVTEPAEDYGKDLSLSSLGQIQFSRSHTITGIHFLNRLLCIPSTEENNDGITWRVHLPISS